MSTKGIDVSTHETAYSPGMTIESAYDFLKTLPQFKGAQDV